MRAICLLVTQRLRVVAAFDIDSDGQRELLVEYDYLPRGSSNRGEGALLFKRNRQSGVWESIGEWACLDEV